MRYQVELDGLRAVAVALVLVYHFDLLPWVTGGFTGVDVFFVLSGYLVTGVVASAMDKGTFSLGDFYVRRVRRLMPALTAVVWLTLLAGLVILLPPAAAELGTQALSAQLQVSNVFFWRSVNYFGLNADRIALLHTWSLGVEAQFYLAYPVVLALLARTRGRFPRWAAPVAVFLCLLGSLGLALVVQPLKPEAAFYLLPTRIWEFAAGALLAPGVLPPIKSVRVRAVLGASGLALVLLGSVLVEASDPFPGLLTLFPVIGTMGVIAGAGVDPVGVGRVLSLPACRYVGLISYSLYLVHWPVIVFARVLTGQEPSWAGRAALCALSVALAAVLYHLVEQRFRRPGPRPAHRAALPGYATAIGGSVAVCLVLVGTNGLPGRFSPDVRRYAEGALDEDRARRVCEGTSALARSPEPCRLGAPGPETALLWGDSHAFALAEAFDAYFAAKGVSARLVFHHGCPPLLETDTRRPSECAEFGDAVAAFVGDDTNGIEDVYLASIWALLRVGDVTDPSGTLLREPAQLAAALTATAEIVTAHGARLHLVKPVPVPGGHVPYDLAAAGRGLRQPPAYDLAAHEAKNAKLFAGFDQVTGLAEIIDPAPLLCQPTCRLEAGGDPLYMDGNHLSLTGSRYLGERLGALAARTPSD